MRKTKMNIILYAIFFILLIGVNSSFSATVHLTEPYIMNATTSSIAVAWLMDVAPSEAMVEYGSTSGLGSSQDATVYVLDSLSTGIVYQAIVMITDLSANTIYYYKIVSKSGDEVTESTLYTFKTAVQPGTPFNFLEISDLQLKDECASTAREMAKYEADLMIFPGDLPDIVDTGTEWFGGDAKADSLAFWRVFQDQGGGIAQYMPIYPAPGNHDWDYEDNVWGTPTYGIGGDDLTTYCQMFRPYYPDQEYEPGGKHWYSFDYGDVHFVSLSVARWWTSETYTEPGRYIWDPIWEGSPQYDWLENDLANTDKLYIIVFQHFPVFGTGHGIVPSFGDPPDYTVNYIHRDLVPLWEKYEVSAVINGHDHTLEHYFVRGIHYCEFSSFGNTYGIGNHSEPHEQTAVYEESLVRGFLWAQVNPDSIKCQVIQGGYKEPGAGNILYEFSIKPRNVSSMVEEAETNLGQFALYQSYPNPFNPSTVIAYQLGKGGHVELILFDIRGRKVRTLVNDTQQAGRQYIHWNGSNDAGETVSSGIYFYRLKAGEYQETRKLNFLR